MSEEPEEELDLSAGMIPHHPLGPISGFDHETGLPIVKRQPKDDAVLAKGQPVMLADGSKGKVAHLIANMRTVRVRTEDGRNVTVSQKSLKPEDSVLARTHHLETRNRLDIKMQKLIVLATIALLCPTVQNLHAQNLEGQIIAAQYGTFKLPLQPLQSASKWWCK